jgi:hypothetical protein
MAKGAEKLGITARQHAFDRRPLDQRVLVTPGGNAISRNKLAGMALRPNGAVGQLDNETAVGARRRG